MRAARGSVPIVPPPMPRRLMKIDRTMIAAVPVMANGPVLKAATKAMPTTMPGIT